MGQQPVVIHVVHSLNLGGAERLAATLAVRLSGKYRVVVACLDEAGLWASEVRAAGVPVIELNRQPGIDGGVAWRLARLARHYQARLLHAHQYTPYFYAVVSRSLAPTVQVLFHEHGRHYPEVRSAKRIRVNKWLFRPATAAIVAVSQDVGERLVEFEGLPRERIRVIYNGIEAAEPLGRAPRRALRATLGLRHDDLVLGTVGRLDPVKNIPLAIRALATLRVEFPRLKLVVIGDGPARAAIENAVAEAGLTEAVKLTGFRDDAAQLVNALDLFLLPSLTEGTSLALVSAMAVGVPAVATAVGGTPEVLEHGRTGWLVPSNDEQALVTGIATLLRQPRMAGQIGAAAREAYLQRFTQQSMIDAFHGLYRELLGEDGTTTCVASQDG